MGVMKRLYTRRQLGIDRAESVNPFAHLQGMTNEQFRDRLKRQPKKTKREAEFDRQLDLFLST